MFQQPNYNQHFAFKSCSGKQALLVFVFLWFDSSDLKRRFNTMYRSIFHGTAHMELKLKLVVIRKHWWVNINISLGSKIKPTHKAHFAQYLMQNKILDIVYTVFINIVFIVIWSHSKNNMYFIHLLFIHIWQHSSNYKNNLNIPDKLYLQGDSFEIAQYY